MLTLRIHMCYNFCRNTFKGGYNMYCKFCGKEIDDNARFCPSCGGSFADSISSVNDRIQEQTNTQFNTSDSKKQGLAIASLILGIASLIFVFNSFIFCGDYNFCFSIPCAFIGKYLGKESIRKNMDGMQYAKIGNRFCNIAIVIDCIIALIAILPYLIK